MTRAKFDDKYVLTELRKVGDALTSPVTLYLIGGAAMIRFGLKAATKDIDVLFPTNKGIEDLIQALSESGYMIIKIERLAPEYQMMFASRILENADGFRWDIFQEVVCRKLKLSTDMIERSIALLKTGMLTIRLISKEDIFFLKTVTERDNDEADLLMLARSGINWEIVMTECMNQSRDDMRCEIDLCDKLDKLETSYGLTTPIYSSISKAAKVGMEKWFESSILKELYISPKTSGELLKRFKCGRKILMPSLARLEKEGKIEVASDKYRLKITPNL